MRIQITKDPFPLADRAQARVWPARWIRCTQTGPEPFVTAYRRQFTLTQPAKVRLHVSADERYELFLDGRRIGRGPERGSPDQWFFESYELKMPAGEHVLVARVWSLGSHAPVAQMTVAPGFILATEGRFGRQLNTGIAVWTAKRLDGYSFMPADWRLGHYHACGSEIPVDGRRYPWGVETGAGDGWQPVEVGEPGGDTLGYTGVRVVPRVMVPSRLPAMMDQPRRVAGRMVVPANTTKRTLIDLKNYYCAYPQLTLTGGRDARVTVLWSEALFDKPKRGHKGNRDETRGRFFEGRGDVFIADGGTRRQFMPLWWRAGRYIELTIQTANEPVTMEELVLRETRYPLEPVSEFRCNDRRLDRVIPIGMRALQMCSHETYMDCPYYEQLMYGGDTRLEALITYTHSHDDRLPRKAIVMFDSSRAASGLTQSRFPCRTPQWIPPFSLWWVGMVHDFARWRDDREFVRARMLGVRAVIEAFLSNRNKRGLVEAPVGWNFVDWVPAWPTGIPADGVHGVSGLVNWQLVLALQQTAALERWLGETDRAEQQTRLADELADRVSAAFWNARRGQFADDLAHRHYSEHSQCLAILAGQKARLTGTDLARTTMYFTHYLFEAYRVLGRPDAIFRRLKLWFDLEKQGFKTTPEAPEPSRSDCHAWGAHPLFHYHATLAGIRPASFGFREVEIRPQLGPLRQLHSRIPHPRGWIEVDLTRTQARVALPRGVTGKFIWKNREIPLRGRQLIKF
jgi:hypothetical protein